MHESCKLKGQPLIPTRLLYLGDERVRLLVPADLPSRPKYATLSHCWGNLSFVTLKKSSLASFREVIPDNTLTKTFLDAIYIARFLDIEYLWIDSLCIIQDDKDDWPHESSLMGSVYGGSVVTIAAAVALDGRSGCFRDRKETWRCRARPRPHPMVDREITYDFSCVDIKSDAHRVSPLCSRGWTFQEQILSPRTLSFNETEVFWEFHEHTACESLPFGTGSCDINDRWQIGQLSRMRTLDYSWTTVIKEYSKRKLTKNSDKLVAISILARLEHQKTNDTYVAGLWHKDLEKQLF